MISLGVSGRSQIDSFSGIIFQKDPETVIQRERRTEAVPEQIGSEAEVRMYPADFHPPGTYAFSVRRSSRLLFSSGIFLYLENS